MKDRKGTAVEEVQFLADLLFDSHASPHQLQRLEELITSDLGCLQAYVERIGFHSDLMKQATERNSVRQAESALNRILKSRARFERRQKLIIRTVLTVCSVLLFGAVIWIGNMPRRLTPQIGVIANLTTEVAGADGTLKLGQVVREKGVYSIETGIVSLQLPNVTVDLLGPVTVELISPKEILLKKGTLHATVQQGGEGFSVRTPGSVIVDLGTDFSVEYQPKTGTSVNVSKGRVQASLLDLRGNPTNLQEITDQRSVLLSERHATVKEISFSPVSFQLVEQARGTIRSIDGSIRTLSKVPESLAGESLPTPDNMLVIPERQDVLLEQEVVVQSIDGEVRLPAGTKLASYLVHYDPTAWTTFSPRGAVTFDGRIAAVIHNGNELNKSDSQFGLSKTSYEQKSFRELELDEDEVRISNDRKTVSFYFGVSGSKSLDQARVLVVR